MAQKKRSILGPPSLADLATCVRMDDRFGETGCVSLSLSAPLSAISRSLAKLFIFFAVRKIVLNRGWEGKIGKLFLNIGLNGRLIRDIVITVTTIGREI